MRLLGPPRPPVEKSHDLAEYIKNELDVAWRTQIDQDPVRALNFMAKTFAAPGLITHSLSQAISNDQAAAALECAFRWIVNTDSV